MHAAAKCVVWSLLVAILIVGLAACRSSEQPAAETSTAAPTVTEAPASSAAATNTPAPAAESQAPADASSQASSDTTGGAITFQIVQDASQARFFVDEVLLGQPKTVEGVTSLVTGQITVDPTDPSGAQIGVIQIDARDLTTDSDRRNTSIRRFVLQSARDDYRYITFEPTSIEGMPEAVAVGQPFEFTVTGNLTIRDVTRPETFQMSVTANSESELVGLGSTIVQRGNYGLTIPSVPAVANVSEDARLEIEFTARTGQ
jgi:polyisoprenoid-binding protein YceI